MPDLKKLEFGASEIEPRWLRWRRYGDGILTCTSPDNNRAGGRHGVLVIKSAASKGSGEQQKVLTMPLFIFCTVMALLATSRFVNRREPFKALAAAARRPV